MFWVVREDYCVQDKLLLKQDPESFRSVLGAKVSGLLAMGSTLGLAPLQSILLFSSVSSIVAPLGQPNYAAANAMLNAWANTQGTQVTSFSTSINTSTRTELSQISLACLCLPPCENESHGCLCCLGTWLGVDWPLLSGSGCYAAIRDAARQVCSGGHGAALEWRWCITCCRASSSRDWECCRQLEEWPLWN